MVDDLTESPPEELVGVTDGRSRSYCVCYRCCFYPEYSQHPWGHSNGQGPTGTAVPVPLSVLVLKHGVLKQQEGFAGWNVRNCRRYHIRRICRLLSLFPTCKLTKLSLFLLNIIPASALKLNVHNFACILPYSSIIFLSISHVKYFHLHVHYVVHCYNNHQLQ